MLDELSVEKAVPFRVNLHSNSAQAKPVTGEPTTRRDQSVFYTSTTVSPSTGIPTKRVAEN